MIIFRIHSDKKEKHNEFHIEGKHAKILGWGGTIDKENATTQDTKVQCDLLEAFTTVKQSTASKRILDNKSGGPPALGVGDDIVRGIVCTMFYIFFKHR